MTQLRDWVKAPLSGASYSAAELTVDNDAVLLLEQRALPQEERYVVCRTSDEVAAAISNMVVRGAPAIGIAAAYGMVLATPPVGAPLFPTLEKAASRLEAARPTAVNLAWAVEYMWKHAMTLGAVVTAETRGHLAAVARRIHEEDVASCRAMGRLGATRMPSQGAVLTHCNAGALATGGFGTALGVFRAAQEAGKELVVYADETRPYLQGARLTAWELQRDGFDVRVLPDNAAASLLRSGKIAAVVVGADRIAANGDVANKVGTLAVACLCHTFGVPFYVAAPWSTVDLLCPSGEQIIIEERPAVELLSYGGLRLAPEGVGAFNPGFDVTPAEWITAIFTERGIVEPVGRAGLAAFTRGPVAVAPPQH